MSEPTASPTVTVTSTTTVTSHFRMVFLTVAGLTVTLLISLSVLSLVMPDPTEQQQKLLDLFTTLVTAGFGAIVGLIGGKLT
jgi:hypothetical protein